MYVSQELRSLRGIFGGFAKLGGAYDHKTAAITPFIVDEIGNSMDTKKTAIARGKEALALLDTLPPYRDCPSLHVPSFPHTRAILWKQVIGGIFYSDAEGLENFVQAIVNPGKISWEEEESLKTTLKEGLLEYANISSFRRRICTMIKKNKDACAEVPLRTLLHFVASKCTVEELKQLLL